MCFRSDTPDASGGILFSGLSEKSMQKRDVGDANSAYAPEKAIRYAVRLAVTSSVVRTPFGRPADRVSQTYDARYESFYLRPLNI